MLAYYDFVYHLACAFLGDPDEASDAAQETFLQAALHIDQYECGTSLKSWIAKIAVNTCRSRYRKQKARCRLESVLKVLSFQTAPFTPSPEEHAVAGEQQRLLRQAVDALDEKHRLPVLLRYVHGFSVPEIARTLAKRKGPSIRGCIMPTASCASAWAARWKWRMRRRQERHEHES